MPIVAVVHSNASVRAGLRRGLRKPGVGVRTCRSVPAVRRLLAVELVDAVVVDLVRLDPDAVFALAGAFPRVPVFALSAFRPDDGVLIHRSRRQGLRDVLVESVDRPVAAEMIGARSASRERLRVLADAPRVLRLTESIQRRAFFEVMARAGRPTRTTDIARALGRTREHLSREFAAGGAPNLKRVIDLARAICAADLLGNPGYAVSDVARVLRFSSPSHFAEAARRIAGSTPAGLAALGPRGVFLRFLKGRTRSRI